MSLRLSVLLVWALVAAAAVFWSLKLFARGAPVPVHASVAANPPTLNADLSRLLGADTVAEAQTLAAPVADTRYALVGVVNPRGDRHAREGIALIVVDDKPARSFRVGAVVDGERVLQSLNLRGVTLGPRGGPAEVTLSIPPPAEANRGRPVFAGFGPNAPPPGPGGSPASELVQPPQRQPSMLGINPPPGDAAPGANPRLLQ